MIPANSPRAGGVAVLDYVLAELDRLIVDELAPGTKLPAEGELATRLGVSRLTIREAMKVLAGQELVELRAGARATVKAPSSVALSRHLDVFIRRDPSTVLELSELRMGLEVQAASLAAERATPASMLSLENAMTAMRRAANDFAEGVGDEEAYHEADLDFHEALAVASGNRMLAIVLTSLEDSMRASFVHSFRGQFTRGSTLADRLGLHERVAELVAVRDVRGATAAMTTLLAVSERDIRASLGPSIPLRASTLDADPHQTGAPPR
ncbi:MAG: FadR family transcriptional regulator [Salinibacterium sp.]|nr:FadR family transcriptional regulator [Salinibacterium sp.]